MTLTSIANRITYERTFTLSERWERGKDRAEQFVAWQLLPARISKDHGIPAETALRDMARKRAKPEGDRMAVGE